MSSGVSTLEVFSIEEAQGIFRQLVTLYKTRALWFLPSDIIVDIFGKSSISILDHIAVKCTRPDWVQVKKLKQWLLQNSK